MRNAPPEYNAWLGMKARCYNQKHTSFKYYGARGITVCERWRTSFKAFLEDVGPRPSVDHTIEREDSKRNYEPGNVKWATRIDQQRNTSYNVVLEWCGKSQCITAWADETGIPANVLYQRIDDGFSVEDALTRPVRKTNRRK